MNVSLKAKLYLLSSAAIAALMVFCGMGYYSINSLLELEENRVRIANIQRDILNLRRIEKDFLTLPEQQHSELFKAQHDSLTEIKLALAASMERNGQPNEKFVQLNHALDNYATSFYRMIELQSEIGLDHKSGLHGKLREMIHQVEKVLKQQNDKALMADMLLLRRNEKDFFQRKQASYHERFDANLERFVKELRRSNTTQTLTLVPMVRDYQEAFADVVHAYTNLGLTEDLGEIGHMRSQAHLVEGLLGELSEQVAAAVDHEVDGVYQSISSLIILVAGSLLLLSLWLVNTITGPIGKLVQHMKNIASGDGDLTVRLVSSGSDELAQLAHAFNQFVSKIQGTVQQVSDVSSQLASASEQSLAVSRETGRGVDAIHEETTQLVTSMSQMVASAQEVAQSSAEAKRAAGDAEEQAEQGTQVASDAVTAMDSLAGELDSVSVAIGKLAQDSEKITSVMEVIQNITEQTNLLALNAAIEAARAGESGRGFAVVADEVRGLAKRTHLATQEIQQMVENLQHGVTDTVRVVQVSYEKSHDSVAKVNDIRHALQEISQSISAINDRNVQIASAAEEESVVTKEINSNIASISDRANSTHDGTRQMIETGQSLAELASQLQDQVTQFKV